MQAFLAIFLAMFFSWSAFAGSHEPAWKGPWAGLPELLPILESVPEGARTLREARAKDPNFLAKIHRGEVSFTESTFARSYSLLDGQEEIELRHEITLGSRLSLADAVVDLAHELVHFTEKEVLDPYKPGFELKQFVSKGIEGQGGELGALERECYVAWALKKRYPTFPRHRLCVPYLTQDGVFDRARAKQDYYALGRWYGKSSSLLEEGLPVSREPAVFTSSYARKPYPIALAEEFVATREAACANNRRKYKLIAAQAEGYGRAPASSLLQERHRLRTYDLLYCRSSKKDAAP